MNSNAKRLTASAAALMILLYHCWIPVLPYGTLPGSVERFLIAATFPGVDIFFFLSAYSLVSRPVTDYKGFLKNRAIKLLPLFFIALIAGQFLWFLPSIMILYLFLPPLYRVCRRRPVLSFFLLMAGWAGITALILGVLRPAQDFGIFLFRIPVIILGAYAVYFRSRLSRNAALVTGILLLAAGTVLIYFFGFRQRLNVPFRGTFYLTGIPAVIGIVLILERVAEGFRSRAISYFGSITLELYFAQMVLGTVLVELFFRLTRSRLVTNLIVLAAVIAAAVLIRKGAELGKKLIDYNRRIYQ